MLAGASNAVGLVGRSTFLALPGHGIPLTILAFLASKHFSEITPKDKAAGISRRFVNSNRISEPELLRCRLRLQPLKARFSRDL